MGRFSGKRILITGGSSGIGFVGAKRIVDEGGEVGVTGYSADHLEQAGRGLPPGSMILRNDAADPAAAEDLAKEVKQIGKLDGLWLNAGFAAVRPVSETDAGFFDRMMNANVRGPILQIAKLADSLDEGASIVLTRRPRHTKAPLWQVSTPPPRAR